MSYVFEVHAVIAMGNKTQFYIELNGNKTVYAAGEFICGNAVVETQNSLNYKSIEVKFGGSSYLRWTETSGTGDDRHTDTYSASEKYFKTNIILLQSGVGDASGNLSVGRHVFPFQFQLPPNLPTSIEVRDGWVRYTIKGKIDRSGIFSNHRTRLLFTVLDVLDLNHVPNARQPAAECDTKTLCCCCCASGPIEAKVNSDKTGYVPGEFITVRGSIENKSNADLSPSCFNIVQMVTQRATTKTRTFSDDLVKVTGQGCRRRSSVQLGPYQLQIPAVPPSHLRHCSIMDIEYFVQLCVDTPTCSLNFRVNAPLEIGTVPLLAGETSYPPPPIHSSETTFVPGSTSASSAPTSAYQAPPPSYAAATEVTLPQKDFEGPSTYAPQYNYYDWSQSAFTYN